MTRERCFLKQRGRKRKRSSRDEGSRKKITVPFAAEFLLFEGTCMRSYVKKERSFRRW